MASDDAPQAERVGGSGKNTSSYRTWLDALGVKELVVRGPAPPSRKILTVRSWDWERHSNNNDGNS